MKETNLNLNLQRRKFGKKKETSRAEDMQSCRLVTFDAYSDSPPLDMNEDYLNEEKQSKIPQKSME